MSGGSHRLLNQLLNGTLFRSALSFSPFNLACVETSPPTPSTVPPLVRRSPCLRRASSKEKIYSVQEEIARSDSHGEPIPRKVRRDQVKVHPRGIRLPLLSSYNVRQLPPGKEEYRGNGALTVSTCLFPGSSYEI